MTDQTTTIFPERTVEYAGFWRRFVAAFLDGMLIGIISTGIRLVITGSLLEPSMVGTLLGLIAGWLYSALMESGAGQATLGKRALGVKVTNLQGGRISFLQATGRHFGKIISFLILLIGYLMVIWDAKKQTLHDKMAGTLVVRSGA